MCVFPMGSCLILVAPRPMPPTLLSSSLSRCVDVYVVDVDVDVDVDVVDVDVADVNVVDVVVVDVVVHLAATLSMIAIIPCCFCCCLLNHY